MAIYQQIIEYLLNDGILFCFGIDKKIGKVKSKK